MGLFDLFKKKSDVKTAVKDTSSIEPMHVSASVQPSKKKTTPKEKGQKHRLAGVKYYEKNIMKLAVENADYALTKDKIIKAGLTDSTIYKFTFPSEPVALEPEPENEQDPNAIKVILDGQHIGYIKAGSCSRVHNLIKNGKIGKIVCTLSGGPYKGVFDESADPDECHEYHFEKGTASFNAYIRIFEPNDE